MACDTWLCVEKLKQTKLSTHQLEKLEKLSPLEAKMRKLELIAQSIADRMLYFQKREKEMRQTNGKQIPNLGDSGSGWRSRWRSSSVGSLPACIKQKITEPCSVVWHLNGSALKVCRHFLSPNSFHQQPCAVPQRHLHGVFERAGHVASFLFEAFLQETKADRVNTFFQLTPRASSLFRVKTQHSINYETGILFC